MLAGVSVGTERAEVQGGLGPTTVHIGVIDRSNSGSKLARAEHPDI